VLEAEMWKPTTPGLVESLMQTARDLTKLRIEVVLLPTGSLPNDGKLIEDRR
jgi:phenylacetate-CoA ligase